MIDTETQELIVDVSQGNHGALRVACNAVNDGRTDIVKRCQELEIKGPKVWLAFRDLGDDTLSTFYATVESADIKERLAAIGY